MKKSQPPTRIGRKRRTLGWPLLTLGMLVAAVWITSRWCVVFFVVRTSSFEIANGSLSIATPYITTRAFATPNESPGWETWLGWNDEITAYGAQQRSRAIVWTSGEVATGFWYARVLLWPIPLLLCTPAAFLLHSGVRARRRALTGICAACGYNLAGLAPSALCPECGITSRASLP